MKGILYKIIGFFAFFLLWEICASLLKSPFIPHLNSIFINIALLFINKLFYKALITTLIEIISGVIIAFAFSSFISSIMIISKSFQKSITPVIDFIRHIPTIALFPLLMALFGITPFTRIVLIFLNSFPSILLSSYYGLKTVDYSVIEAGKVAGANKLQILTLIRFPIARGEILNGIKISIGNSFVAIVVAEMLGATNGLGFMIMWATNAFNYPEVYAYISILAVLGIIINLIFDKVIKIIQGEKE